MRSGPSSPRVNDIVAHRLSRRGLVKAAGAGLAGAALTPLVAPHVQVAAQSSADSQLLHVGVGQNASWVRNFNPLVPDSLWPSQYAIHEPLLIYNTATGKTMPWLATEWAFSPDNKQLTFTIRDGVKWSDGQPFTARDAAFTLNLLKQNTGLSGSGGIRGIMDFIDNVAAKDDKTLVVTFGQVFTPALYQIGQQSIVPEHIWKDVKDPVRNANENPVGTGPFTQVENFKPQYYELHKNPNYWQQGKPMFEGLAFPTYASNDAGTLMLINGEMEWNQLFIPDIEKTFVAKDPKHFHYWFPLIGSEVTLYLNTTQKPFDDINVRKAISMGVNRQQMCTVAVYDYTHPGDATGMSDLYKQWKNQAVIDAGKDLVSFNPDKANKLLDDAGYKKSGDVRQTPDGKPMEYDIIMPSGWSDWVQDGQIIAQNLKKIGINVKTKGVEVTAYYDATYQGNFSISLGDTGVGATPFDHFQEMMSPKTVKPVGQTAAVNWHRYGSEKVGKLLEQFAATSDEKTQHDLCNQMQQAFLDEWPAVPLYPGPRWGECSTKNFVDFPSEDNPYALLSPATLPETLVTLTTVKPAGQ